MNYTEPSAAKWSFVNYLHSYLAKSSLGEVNRTFPLSGATGDTTPNRVAKATGDTTTPNSVESVAKATGDTITPNRVASVAKVTGDTATPNSVESVAKATGYTTPSRVAKATGYPTPNSVESVAKATGDTTPNRVASVAEATGDTTPNRVAGWRMPMCSNNPSLHLEGHTKCVSVCKSVYSYVAEIDYAK